MPVAWDKYGSSTGRVNSGKANRGLKKKVNSGKEGTSHMVPREKKKMTGSKPLAKLAT